MVKGQGNKGQLRAVGMDSAERTVVEERPPSRRSHQFRALSRRTGTYHRRQWKLDLCCLGLCPAVSVIIAGILGFVARHFADLSSTSTANSTTLLSDGKSRKSKCELMIGILSCSDINTGTNPSFFPAQDAHLQYTKINGIVMQPVNFHIEPLRIGNLFNSTAPDV